VTFIYYQASSQLLNLLKVKKELNYGLRRNESLERKTSWKSIFKEEWLSEI
jgi:hypothetical protein